MLNVSVHAMQTAVGAITLGFNKILYAVRERNILLALSCSLLLMPLSHYDKLPHESSRIDNF